ncbi:hypothetical protein TRVL_09770 [Trypanosoma vivax]|nr:hypothetical protein TRVL_09770 [Trypanosoma vivax]
MRPRAFCPHAHDTFSLQPFACATGCLLYVRSDIVTFVASAVFAARASSFPLRTAYATMLLLFFAPSIAPILFPLRSMETFPCSYLLFELMHYNEAKVPAVAYSLDGSAYMFHKIGSIAERAMFYKKADFALTVMWHMGNERQEMLVKIKKAENVKDAS